MEHGPLFYLSSWSLGLVLSIFSLALGLRLPFFRERVVRTETARTRSFPRSYRLGGFFLAAVFLFLLFLDARLEHTDAFIALCVGSVAIMAFSLADDFTHILWPWHIGFQLLLGSLLFFSGMRFQVGTYFLQLSYLDESALVGVVLVLIWTILVMNALNWSDGIDGLMPGVSAVSFGTLFLLSLRPEVNQPTVAILSIILFALSLSLLFFNWYPARILAGTGGAYFFGFTLAALGLYAGMKIATLFLVLAVPVFDAAFVIIRRFARGQSLFQPDEEHLHHLLRSLGWSADKISLAYLSLTLFMGALALSIEGERKLEFFVLVGSLIGIVTLALHLYLGKLLAHRL
ncbi:MAG: MraY family glycosyltransferase [Undibacterium sp.]